VVARRQHREVAELLGTAGAIDIDRLTAARQFVALAHERTGLLGVPRRKRQ
jgi:hypothetical protein